jgi:Tfp pilus assembly protein FimT
MSRRRRQGLTLVELLVSMALIIFIMVILSEAFKAALASFRSLKAIGDMQERLRSATTALHRDLTFDHFEGKRRLSDPSFYSTALNQGPPREGFFHIRHGARLAGQDENTDATGDQLPVRRRTNQVLHFSIKVRGNSREHFLTAKVPANSPLFTTRTTFFDHPIDARYQDSPTTYTSQWAEVAYFLVPNGTSAGTTPLYTLYRAQMLVVPDNSFLNWPASPPVVPATALPGYLEMSCKPSGTGLYFNNPTDLAVAARRAFDPANPDPNRAATQIVTDVISFDVQFMRGAANFSDFGVNGGTYDTASSTFTLTALQITLRIWDVKTQQARQITIVQEL